MNPDETDDDWLRSEDDELPRGLTLDLVELTGRADRSPEEIAEIDRAARARERGYDTVEDVVASRRRKGNAATAAEAPMLIDTLAAGVMEPTAEAGSEATRRAAARAGRARREFVTDLGDTFEDVVEPLVPDAWEDTGTSSATGAVHGATLGAADEIGGALSEVGNLPDVMSGREDFGDAYRTRRDELREIIDADRESSPIAFGAGELAGALATAPIIPTGPRAATMLGRLGGAALEGAALGGVAGGFGSNAETAPEMLEAAGRGALGGAVFGTGGGLLGEGIEAGGRALTRAGERADELRVASVLGSGNSPLSVRAQRDVEALPGGMAGAAERIRRLGIGSRAGTIEDAAREASRAVDDTDRALGEFYGELDAALPEGIPADRFADSFEGVADELAANPETAPLAERYMRRAERWREGASGGERMTGTGPRTRTPPGRMSTRGVRDALGVMRNGVDFIAANEGRTAAAAELDAYRAGRRALDDVAEDVLPAERAAEFRPMRDDAATARVVERYARQAAMRADRAGPSLTAGMAGNAAAAMGGGPAATAAAAIGSGILRRRMPALRATTAEAVRALISGPEAAALGAYGPVMRRALARGADVFAGTHAALMRADPDYAAAVEAAAGPPPTLGEYIGEPEGVDSRPLSELLREARGGAPADTTTTVDRRSVLERLREARGE